MMMMMITTPHDHSSTFFSV